MTDSLLSIINKEIKKEFEDTTWSGSLEEFLKRVETNPKANVRTAFQYLNDMIHYFGSERFNDCGDDLIKYKLFDDPFNDGENAIHGNHRALLKIVYYINATAEQGAKERILILRGPVATAKTSIIRLLMEGLEEYSKTPEGGFYKFSWVFPRENVNLDPGFKIKRSKEKELESYAHLDREKVFKIPCQLNENPLMLYPKKQRMSLLKNFIEQSEKNIVIPEKIKKNALCYNCQNIYNFLLTKYEGDVSKVLKHIKVERFILSEMNQTGLATIQPTQNVDSKSQTITWESSKYAEIQKILPGIVLDMFGGKWADANRGIIHLTDLFQRQGAYLRPLSSAIQENLVDFNGPEAYIDTVIIGTTNLAEHDAFKKNLTNAGLKDRIRRLEVPYVLQNSEEAKIYEKQFRDGGYLKKKIKDSKHVCPHTIDLLSLWIITTRLKKSDVQSDCYPNEFEALEQLKNLSLVQKALLYDGNLNNFFDLEEKRVYKDKEVQKLIRNEFPKIEGMDVEGSVSPRQVQNMITDIIAKKEYEEKIKGIDKKCLGVFKIFKGIEDFYKKNKEENEMGANTDQTLIKLKIMYKVTVEKEIKLAIADIDEQTLVNKIKEYVENVTAYVQKKGILGKSTSANEDKMRWMEEKLSDHFFDNQWGREEFRQGILQEIACADIKQGEEIDYKTIFKDIYDSLETMIYTERFKSIGMSRQELKLAFESYNTEDFEKLDLDHKKEVNRTIDYLVSRFDYCPNCAKDVILYSFENQLIRAEEEWD